MKRYEPILTFLLSSLLLCSCTHTVYTHQQVLQKCHTKSDVLKQFGEPDEKLPGAEMEEWVYNMDKPHPPPKPKNKDVPQSPSYIAPAHPDSLHIDSVQYAQAYKYERSVKFIFDAQGNVAGYKADNVN